MSTAAPTELFAWLAIHIRSKEHCDACLVRAVWQFGCYIQLTSDFNTRVARFIPLGSTEILFPEKDHNKSLAWEQLGGMYWDNPKRDPSTPEKQVGTVWWMSSVRTQVIAGPQFSSSERLQSKMTLLSWGSGKVPIPHLGRSGVKGTSIPSFKLFSCKLFAICHNTMQQVHERALLSTISYEGSQQPGCSFNTMQYAEKSNGKIPPFSRFRTTTWNKTENWSSQKQPQKNKFGEKKKKEKQVAEAKSSRSRKDSIACTPIITPWSTVGYVNLVSHTRRPFGTCNMQLRAPDTSPSGTSARTKVFLYNTALYLCDPIWSRSRDANISTAYKLSVSFPKIDSKWED